MNRMVSVYLFLLELLNMHKNSVSYKVIGTRDRILYGYSFRNITGILKMEECLAKCLEDCKCLSFQICIDDNMCQLCSTNSNQNEGSIQQKNGCTSFVFEREQPLQTGMSVQKSCLKDTNCCLTSQPCRNGASCLPLDPATPVSNIRFTCKCRPGYQGLHCDQPIRSCRGHLKTRKSKNGIYYVIDNKGNTFPVLCRFNSKARTVWTLIQKYRSNYTLETSLKKSDSSVNEDNPTAVPYRLSSFRMKSIRQNSTTWRITRRGRKKNEYCWNTTFVTIDVPEENCTSCKTYEIHKYANTTSNNNRDEKECNLSYYGSHECKDPDAGGNTDNYGSYCCYNSSFHGYPSELKLISEIWLGEKYPKRRMNHG